MHIFAATKAPACLYQRWYDAALRFLSTLFHVDATPLDLFIRLVSHMPSKRFELFGIQIYKAFGEAGAARSETSSNA